MEKYLESLNDEQRAAAMAVDGYNFILAGAGTGKTKTLIARLVYMIDHGVAPCNILMVTFTNKAADEMRVRAKKALEGKDVNIDEAEISTFHSFCASMLRKFWDGMSSDFRVIDSSDTEDAMKLARQEIMNKYQLKAKEFSPVSFFLDVHAYASDNDCPETEAIEAMIEEEGEGTEDPERIAEVMTFFRNYKAQMNLVDYDDLQVYMADMLRESPIALKALGLKYKYIACDEYQDTNKVQSDVLNMLAAQNGNLTVVGDDNQSIYKFRGAEVANILGFEKEHPGCRRFNLIQNYRSTQEILDVSNALMKYATEGIPKELISANNRHGPRPTFHEAGTASEEAQETLDCILNCGEKLSDCAVLFRNGIDSTFLEALLTREGVDYVKHGGQKFMEKSSVRDLMAFLRMATNPKDELASFRVLGLMPGIGDTGAHQIAAAVASGGIDALRKENPRNAKEEAMETIGSMLEAVSRMKLHEQFDRLSMFYLNLRQKMMEHDLETKESADKMKLRRKMYEAKEDTDALRAILHNYHSVSHFLSDMALENRRVEEDNADVLTLSTIHSAKGLEWKCVWFISAFDKKEDADLKDDAEERRCVYVALTRAKDLLSVSYPRFNFMTKKLMEPLHFFEEPGVLDTFNIQ